MCLRGFGFLMWIDLDVEDIWNRGIEAKLLCLKELSKEEARKGIVSFIDLELKAENIACRQGKTCFEIRF